MKKKPQPGGRKSPSRGLSPKNTKATEKSLERPVHIKYDVPLPTRMHGKECVRCKTRVWPFKDWWDEHGPYADYVCMRCDPEKRYFSLKSDR